MLLNINNNPVHSERKPKTHLELFIFATKILMKAYLKVEEFPAI